MKYPNSETRLDSFRKSGLEDDRPRTDGRGRTEAAVVVQSPLEDIHTWSRTRWGKHTNRTGGRTGRRTGGEVQTRERRKGGSYHLVSRPSTDQLSPISLHLSEYELTTTALERTAAPHEPTSDRDMGICNGGREGSRNERDGGRGGRGCQNMLKTTQKPN